MWPRHLPWRWRTPTSWSRQSRSARFQLVPNKARVRRRSRRNEAGAAAARFPQPHLFCILFICARNALPTGPNERPSGEGKERMALIPRLGMLVAAALALSLPATAQDYPTRSVKIIVPFGAGGPADVFARI